MSGTHVLVTGGAGYIGSHTAKRLSSQGITPLVFDNFSTGHRWAVGWGPVVDGDLRETDKLRQAMRQYRIDAVIHFAAVALVGESMGDPGLYFATNCSGTLSLLEAMRLEGVRHIVVSSSCATYGIPEKVPISETESQRPVSPYGESKLMMERMLHWYAEAYGLKWVALRYFNAAGADPEGALGEAHYPESHLMPRVILAALHLEPEVLVFGEDYPTEDGTAVRDYVHVADLADAHTSALDYLLANGANTAFNLGTGQGYSVRNIIEAVARHSGLEVPFRIVQRRRGDPAIVIADPAKAAKTLSWRPVHSSLDNLVTTAWKWHSGQNVSLYHRRAV